MPLKAQTATSTKRAKSVVDEQHAGSSSSGQVSMEEQLSALYSTLSQTSDLNPLVDLIALLNENLNEQRLGEKNDVAIKTLHKGLHFLVRSVQALLKEDRILIASVNEDGQVAGGIDHLGNSEKAVSRWLQARWNDAIALLCSLLASRNEDTRWTALRLLMALQRDASSYLSRQHNSLSAHEGARRGQWSNTPWRALCDALVEAPSTSDAATRRCIIEDDVVQAFTDDYLQQYDDVRYAFCRTIANFLEAGTTKMGRGAELRRNAVRFFWGLTAIPTKLDDLNTYLISELETSRRAAQKSEKARPKASRDSEGEEEVEDWFSDSDEEGTRAGRDGAKGEKSSKGAGLGSAAQAAAENKASRRRLKRNPPFADAVHSLSAQKAAYSRAWLSILLPKRSADGTTIGGALDLAATHEALVRLHSQILPHLVKPNLLHDFLVDALNAGGATSLLALNGLFTLMTKHNLNYPSFYKRLYALLLSDPPVLHVRYRSRFLRLLDAFLSSTHLSATLVASFAKRLSRMALRAPPSAIVVVIPFVWNLCKRHKPCLGLIHREFGGDRFDQGPAGLPDPYDALESDPLETGAIDSSLWELAAMGALLQQQLQSLDGASEGQAHYLASVSSISRILAEPFTKERYDLEDFLDLTYTTLFETETKKTLHKREGRRVVEPAVAFDLPRSSDRKRAPTFPVAALGGQEGAKHKKQRNDVETRPEQDDAGGDDGDGDEGGALEHNVDMTSRIFTF